MESNTLAIALGVSVPLVVVIAAALVLVVILRSKSVQSREIKRVKQKIAHSIEADGSGAPNRPQSTTIASEPRNEETRSRSESSWKQGNKGANLKNSTA